MNAHGKSLPQRDDSLTGPFWTAAHEHRLVVQRCDSCSYLRWPPARVCPECLAAGGEWTDVSPTGTLWSVAEYHRAFDPAFADDVPYSVGLIELDDGPRMYGNLHGDPDRLVLDGRVRAAYVDANDGITLVQWESADDIEI